MPLLQMEQERWNEETNDPYPTDIRSTALLWKFWLKQKRPSHGRPVAIVFRAPKSGWPAEVTFEFRKGRGAAFYRDCTQHQIPLILPYKIHPESVEYMKEEGGGLWHLLANDETHLKQLLREYQEGGTKPFDGDIFQLMFFCPIPSRFIQQMIPLSQRNVTFKARKANAHISEIQAEPEDSNDRP